jgi:hypothetical protein
MSLQVVGTAQVYKIENKGNYVTGTLRTSKKDKKTDEWVSEFYNAKFAGNCKDQAAKLADKDKITIGKAILESRTYEKKTYISVIVFEFTSGAIEAYAEPTANIDEDPDSLPF